MSPFCRETALLQGNCPSGEAADAEVAASLASQNKHAAATKHEVPEEAVAAGEAVSLASQRNHAATTRRKTAEEAAAAEEAASFASQDTHATTTRHRAAEEAAAAGEAASFCPSCVCKTMFTCSMLAVSTQALSKQCLADTYT
jgi:CCR4-NOT transcriptional regulation complex NOT5 subunit